MLDCPSCGKIKKHHIKPGKYKCSSCGTNFIVDKEFDTHLDVKASFSFLLTVVGLCVVLFIYLNLVAEKDAFFDLCIMPIDGYTHTYTDYDQFWKDRFVNKVNFKDYKYTENYHPPRYTILYRAFTAAFVHSNFKHLIYNMIWLVFFGIFVQNRIGMKKFIIYFFLLTFFTGVTLSFITKTPAVGLSGTISGILIAHAWFYPYQEIYYRGDGIPSYIFIIIYFLIELLLYFVADDNISHEGHIIGIFVSLILLMIIFRSERMLFKKRRECNI